MTTQTEALKLALEALEKLNNTNSYWWQEVDRDTVDKIEPAITAIKEALSSEAMTSSPNGEAQPEQKQNLKLMPREATREMLEAMDECSMEGYDERLYAGHAGSVYMAAWDAFHGQHCYCGDITNLGVIHRDDGPCHYPDHKEPEQDKERCVGCEACIDTACGRDECPKGWPKAAQPEQEPVAWRYKPAREDNPRWEYTTNHPLDMGDGYIRPSLVEYCKCIEPLYAKEKPKLMLEKFREMEDLLEEPAQQEPATKEKIREAIVFNLPLYTTPPQRPSRSDIKPLTGKQITDIARKHWGYAGMNTAEIAFARAIEAAHGIKE